MVFAEQMYQWAATITQNGGNLPLILPLKVDRLETGFQVRWQETICAPSFRTRSLQVLPAVSVNLISCGGSCIATAPRRLAACFIVPRFRFSPWHPPGTATTH